MFRQIYLFGLGMTLCLSFCSSTLLAQTQTIDGDPADEWLLSLGPGATGSFVLVEAGEDNATIRAGHFVNPDGSNPANVAGVFVFQLPDVGTVADPFATAGFEFNYIGSDTAAATPTYNIDLYGLGRRSAPVLIADLDFFVGPPGGGAFAVLLRNDLLTPASTPGLQSVNIVNFLNAQYAGGAGAGQFVFLRFSPDFNPNAPLRPVRDAFLMTSANSADTSARPRIEFSLGSFLLGDVNLDSEVDFSDIAFFISLLATEGFQAEADIDGSGTVDFDDISPFITLLSGS